MRLVSAGRLAPVLWAAILLAACGGDGSSGGGGAGGATGGGGGSGGGSGGGTGGGQTFTYSTLADLQGDQTFTTASVSYQDDVQVAGFQAFNLMLQAYSEGPQVEYVAASDIFRLTAPGAAYAVEVSQATPTNSGPNFRQWRVDAGATTDVVTLFEAFGSYAFVGTWGHIEGGVLTNYLMSTGIATQTGDFPTGSVTYNVRMGGSANINVGTGPSAGVDTSRSTGTLTVGDRPRGKRGGADSNRTSLEQALG